MVTARRQDPPGGLARDLLEALAALDRHDLRLSLAQGGLGDIQLPEPVAADRTALEPTGALYLAWKLDRAGLLKAAERIAALFVGGALRASLGPVAKLLVRFWLGRRERLDAGERAVLYRPLFGDPAFETALTALMQDLARLDPATPGGWREGIALETAARRMRIFLGARAGGMTAFAARDILEAMRESLGFLADRRLQLALGAGGTWGLVSRYGGVDPPTLRALVTQGRSGRRVLDWLARKDDRRADAAVIAAARTWLGTRS